jgi:hypothetical protein
MENLFLQMAQHAPFPALVIAMQELCMEYKRNPTAENKAHIVTLCELIAIKDAAEGMGGVDKLKEEVEKQKKAFAFFNPNKN